jgi:protein PhnA
VKNESGFLIVTIPQLDYFCPKRKMPESIKCPRCESLYGYPTGTSMMCPECGHEWNPSERVEVVEELGDSSQVKDANGTVLQDGDTVIIIKDLPVKGASKAIKAGTKVKNIKLTSGDHNIDCKVEGFGAMGLKSIFVRKGS